MTNAMLGSEPREFRRPRRPHEVFSVKLPWQTLWGWERRSVTGGVVARSEQLFTDYVACVCDAQRRPKSL
ncbi:MAG: hypothetical protein ACXWIJ_03015 [Burkholderiales bacterium]